jgi:hypothetical protein
LYKTLTNACSPLYTITSDTFILALSLSTVTLSLAIVAVGVTLYYYQQRYKPARHPISYRPSPVGYTYRTFPQPLSFLLQLASLLISSPLWPDLLQSRRACSCHVTTRSYAFLINFIQIGPLVTSLHTELQCVYLAPLIVPIYIDDITLASKSSTAIDKYVQLLSEHFKCRDLGPTRFLLGVAVERDRPTRMIKLHQHQFILELLEKFGMSDCKPVLTPLPPKLVLSHSMAPSTQEEQDLMSQIPYLSAVGSLQYLAMMTRPDIAHSVAYLARFNANPGLEHWKALKHLFRYVKGTIDHKLTYQGALANKELFLTYSDASHGDCVDTGRSTAGYVTIIAGGAVGWYSKLQTIVALSSTEAEYMAAVEAGKEIAWMRNILSEFGYGVQEPSTLKMDNQSAITVSKNPEHHGRIFSTQRVKWQNILHSTEVMDNSTAS